jgi:prepilin-type processing-associated H-X9-DG protein
MSREVFTWNQSRTYLMADLWFIYSLFYYKPIQGAHSSRSIHNVLFMDGHAAPIELSGNNLIRPPGWSNTRYYLKSDVDWTEYNDQRIGGSQSKYVDVQIPFWDDDPLESGSGVRSTAPSPYSTQ